MASHSPMYKHTHLYTNGWMLPCKTVPAPLGAIRGSCLRTQTGGKLEQGFKPPTLRSPIGSHYTNWLTAAKDYLSRYGVLAESWKVLFKKYIHKIETGPSENASETRPLKSRHETKTNREYHNARWQRSKKCGTCILFCDFIRQPL